jgi:2-succinyl-6-hydroxy-2,4-cyclohexadiene-1-carboxylate synthase
MAEGWGPMILDLNGLKYHVEITGKGHPFVLLHGFTGNIDTWKPFCKKWAEHSKLIMVDIIGHGKTDSPDDLAHYRMEKAAGDLANILDQLNIGQTDVLGYSMGGRLALAFAVRFPERVRKLVLESASPGLKTERERSERRQSDARLAKMILEQGLEAFVDNWENIPLFQSQKRLPPEVREKIRKQRLATNNERGLANSLIGMGTGAQASNWNELSRIDCEVLLITGELDQKFCGIAEEMQQLLKKCRWIVVESCGHAIHVEDEEKFGTIVSGFITSKE